ncbi:MAG TPA: hypothetical protein VGF53_10540 [Pseudolabrys sp.]|jgi:hypothetical protein
MDVTKLLQALEEFIFEVACLAILLPKTFFLLALSPRKAHAYVIEELQKKPEDRFDRFTSPLLLWSAAGILPHFMILSVYAAHPTIGKLFAANTDDLFLKMLNLSAEIRFVALSAFAVSLPLAFAVVIARERKQQVAKSSLREPLYTLCYCTAPVFMAATPLWVILLAQLQGYDADLTDALMQSYVFVLMVWTGWIGVSLFRLHLGIDRKRALSLIGKTYFVFFGLVLLLEMGILMILGTLILGPH